MRIGKWIAAACVGVAGLGFAAAFAADEPVSELAKYYGFRPLELYKLDIRSTNMLAADMNQDGRTDLILVDNGHSRIDILLQRDKPKPRDKSAAQKVNSVENDTRFDHRKVGVDREVSSLVVGDFNHDGRKDLAYFANPDQLIVRLQNADKDWTTGQRFRLSDVQATSWMLAAGDLNNDGRDDLVVLGKNETHVFYQQADGTMAAAVSLMNTTPTLRLAQIADLDGDGRNDLCYLTPEDDDRPFGARLQGEDGQLGPELRCELSKPRGVTLANMDGKPGAELLSIEAQTGRVKIHQLQRSAPLAGELASQLIQYGLGQGGRNRDLATGDINGDGLIDVVVTDPDSAQMLVFLQRKGQGLDLGKTYPGLMGAEQIRIGRLEADKPSEVVVLSTREKSIGVSRVEQGRLSFPQGIPTDRDPLAIEMADLNGDGVQEIIVLGKDRGSSSSSSAKYSLQALSRKGDAWKAETIGGDANTTFTLPRTPDRIAALDANRDGQTDFLIFFGGDRAPQLMLGSKAGKLTEVSGDKGFGLGSVAAGNFMMGKLDKTAFLVAQNNFARNVDLGPGNQWRVLDQYNAAESRAQIVAAATIDLDGKPGPEIALIDQGVKKIRVLRKENNVFRPWREVDIGAFPVKSVQVADLNGDGRDDLLLFGSGKFGVLYAGQSDPRLKQLASFESQLEKTHFQDLAAGDLNGDGIPDIAVIDTQSQFIEILDYAVPTGLRHALYFKVFESKSFGGDDRSGSEPREAVIADVTGDGRADLILLAHDRVLVYPQDSGSKK